MDGVAATGLFEGRRILVVEDEAIIALMIKEALEESGAAVVGPAVTAADALALIEVEPIDGAILDYKLPDGTSLPVADALSARQVPFLFASGDDSNAGGRHATAPKLTKVFDLTELFKMLTAMLRR